MQLPIFKRSFRLLAFKIFHRLKITKPLEPIFEPIKPLLHKADLFMPLEEYVATALLTITLTLPFVFLITRLFLIDLYGVIPIIATVLSIIAMVIMAGVIMLGFIIYPSYIVDNIKRNIELNIPYAATHMATVAGTGVPIYLIFKIIGDFPEYGEISKECRRIARNIQAFGYDTVTALSEVATETPSPSLKDLLWGIVAITRTGGDLRDFLIERARMYMENQKNLESEYLDSLELMAEMYTTLFVAGPVLVVVMGTIMGSMGSLPIGLEIIFPIFIYIGMPLMAIGFMILVESSKPIGA